MKSASRQPFNSCFLLLSIWSFLGLSEDISELEVCQKESFNPQCKPGSVVVMEKALYGRMKMGRCLMGDTDLSDIMGSNPKYIGCNVDILEVMDRRCTGRTNCEVSMQNDDLLKLTTCYKELPHYMIASYFCATVVDGEHNCRISLSDKVAHHIIYSGSTKRCGGTTNPWTIEAPSGQKIKVSLIDFRSNEPGGGGEKTSPFDVALGLIVDGSKRARMKIDTLVRQRKALLYESIQNKITITLNEDFGLAETTKNDSPVGILKFEAIGCSDLIPAEDAWLKRNNNEATVGCYSSRQTWQLRCNGHQWIGVLGNCSGKPDFQMLKEEPVGNKIELDHSAQVAGIFAITGVGLAICLMIIGAGWLLTRKYSTRSKSNQFDSAVYKDTQIDGGQFLTQSGNTFQAKHGSVIDDSAAYFVLDENHGPGSIQS